MAISSSSNFHVPRVLQNEGDLSRYLWANTPASVAKPDPGGQKSTRAAAKASDGVEMKAKGFSPLVQKICSEFDAALRRTLDDLTFYVSQDGRSVEGRGEPLSTLELVSDDSVAAEAAFDLAADNEQILVFAQQAVAESFYGMIETVATKFIDVEAEGDIVDILIAGERGASCHTPFNLQPPLRVRTSSWAAFTRPCPTSARTLKERSLPPRGSVRRFWTSPPSAELCPGHPR